MLERTVISILFRWVAWTLLSALILGGRPWRFPQGGEPLLRSILPSRER